MKYFTYFWILFGVVFAPLVANAALHADFSEDDLLKMNGVFTGDFDAMAEKKVIRILMPYNRAFFFFDGAEPRGLSYESAMQFEKFVNKRLKTKTLKVRALVIPTPREKLLPNLQAGLGDIAIGNLTITEARQEKVEFSKPFAKNISEILVTGKDQQTVKSQFDLSGMEIHVRKSSSYYESLKDLNEVLAFTEKAPVNIVAADEHLEDSDLLEMLSAGLIPAIIIDSHKGNLWKQVFTGIKLHPDAKVRTGGKIAWAMRKNCPQLVSVVNDFNKINKKGTLIGNVIINRYLKSAKYITSSTHGKEMKKFQETVKFFKTYGKQYDFDHLMLAALAYQESRLVQSLRSPVGAVGVMQVMPSTASDKNVAIRNIEKIDPNIHAGTKYLHFMANRYFPKDGGMDALNRAFFTFASYNAGPNRVAKLRKEAKQMGLDPNVWFNNVEVVAAKRIGRETVQYVGNIMKYYVAYKLSADKLESPEKSLLKDK